ncbi:phosphotransferase [Paractinoplanes ferrugineus]|uniref:Phosphotransferase n=1 Tax=Paractinoplanes ferrugineus TaxID=113564 RepID=A0A919J940_9ACTN|nr:hypothetical protein [Actinoplanes ferrugineus]GIE15824.1 phosphotransferase [Actinoplanes ferrugineus]
MKANDWHDPAWVSSAHDWIEAHLDAKPTGWIEEVRVRPWSVTHRVPTSAGDRWFKANTPACAYEAPLATALAEWFPAAVLRPLAIDEQGWLLTADEGPTLRERMAADPGHWPREQTWSRMLQAYAVLQRAGAPHAEALVSLGVPDQRPHTLPAHLKSLLADPAVAADVDVAAVQAVPLDDWCAELSADGIPASVQHDDLTDANVFPTGPTGFRFFDWGDASIAHPFGSLLVALGFAAHVLGVGDGDPALARLRDAYLEPWTDLAPAATLRRSVSLSCRLGRVSRSLSWRRAVRDAALPVDDDFRTAAAFWLGELPQPPVV